VIVGEQLQPRKLSKREDTPFRKIIFPERLPAPTQDKRKAAYGDSMLG
jgi:hypothetical protein